MANPCSAVARRNALSTAIHRNRGRTRRRLGTVALVWHWWRQVPGGLLLFEEILTCPRSQMTCPAGSRLGPAMSLRAVAAAKELFASICDISNFPTASTSTCRSMLRIARARGDGGARGGGHPENNFARRNRRRRPRVGLTAPGGVPPAPNPSPIRRETLAPFWRRGLPLWKWNHCGKPAARTRALACECMHVRVTHAALVSAPGWRTSPLRDETRRVSCRLAAAPRARFEAAKPAPPPDHPGAPSPRGRRTRGSRECRRRDGL